MAYRGHQKVQKVMVQPIVSPLFSLKRLLNHLNCNY